MACRIDMALIHIEQWPRPVEAGRLRILEAALDAGVPYPHGCGSGECGTCKSQLISGDVTLDRYSPEALSEAERASGLILACRARVSMIEASKWSPLDPSSTTGSDAVTLRTFPRFVAQPVAHRELIIRWFFST